MINVDIQQLMDNEDNRYAMTMAVAKRARKIAVDKNISEKSAREQARAENKEPEQPKGKKSSTIYVSFDERPVSLAINDFIERNCFIEK